MFELGPQTNTQALNGQSFQSTSSNTKRQVNSPPPAKLHKNKEKYHSDASKYLQNWAQKMKYPEKHAQNVQKLGEVPNLEESMVELVKNDKGEYEIHQPKPGNLPQNILEDLKKLYKLKSEAAKKMGETKRSEEEVKKITEDLSNVDLD